MKLADILSELGVPAMALLLASLVIALARDLEKSARPERLKEISSWLSQGDLSDLGKIGATLIPFIFDRIFGLRRLSFKFFWRSILASTFFWLILLVVKHPNWAHVWSDVDQPATLIAVIWYITDYFSLVKARSIIKVMSQTFAWLRMFTFFALDITFSYIISLWSFWPLHQ